MVAAGLAAVPSFIRAAFGDSSAGKTVPAPADLDGAVNQARKSGRSLLVLVVPAGPTRLERGQAWGSFLMHGDAADFNLLAPLDVECATMKDVAHLAPDLQGEPWALFLDDKGWHALDAVIPPLVSLQQRQHNNSPEVLKSIDRRIAAIGKMLRDGLRPSVGKVSADRPDPATVHRLRDNAPPGSRWDKVWDCPPCGMSFVPEKSSRFLTFFVKGEPPPPKPPFE